VTNLFSFDIGFSGLDWVPNFEKTRWFLVLRLKKPEFDGLNKLLHVCNRVVKDYGQLPLYAKAPSPNRMSKNKTPIRKPPKSSWDDMDDVSDAFHISIAWTLSSPNQRLLELTESTTVDYMKEISRIQVKIEESKSKVGNIVTSIPLPEAASIEKGLFGV
jgi:U6 snRNA phosphodiesterase